MADQQVTTTRGATLATAVLNESAIQDFKAGLSGALLRPAEAGYDDARKIWNGMIDKRPALIARCRGVADSSAPSASLARTIFCWRCAAEATTWPAMRYATAA